MNHSPGLWRHRAFLKLWASQSISLFGLQFGMVALPLVAVLALQANPSEIGLLATITLLPWLTIGPFAGRLVARVPRRAMLIIAHATRCLGVALVPVLAAFDLLSFGWLCFIAAINGVFSVLFEIAYHAYLPELVGADHLDDGNSKLAITDGLARATGPALAGVAVQALTAPLALLGQALSFGAAALLISRIPRLGHGEADRTVHDQPGAERSDGGFLTLIRQPVLRVLVLCELGYLVAFNVASVAIVIFYVRVLLLSPIQVGLVFGAGSVGGILAGLITVRLLRRLGGRASLITGGVLRAVGWRCCLLLS